jgi:hypothetical protein
MGKGKVAEEEKWEREEGEEKLIVNVDLCENF